MRKRVSARFVLQVIIAICPSEKDIAEEVPPERDPNARSEIADIKLRVRVQVNRVIVESEKGELIVDYTKSDPTVVSGVCNLVKAPLLYIMPFRTLERQSSTFHAETQVRSDHGAAKYLAVHPGGPHARTCQSIKQPKEAILICCCCRLIDCHHLKPHLKFKLEGLNGNLAYQQTGVARDASAVVGWHPGSL